MVWTVQRGPGKRNGAGGYLVVTTGDGWGMETYITNDHVLLTQMSIMKETEKQRKRSSVITFRRE